MAIKFQYNKTSRQQLENNWGYVSARLPTLQSKETALRVEVKKSAKRNRGVGQRVGEANTIIRQNDGNVGRIRPPHVA